MIRNDKQLKGARDYVLELQSEIDELRSQYSGIEAKIFSNALELDIQRLEKEIRDYTQLRMLSLEEAVEDVLREPILVDNIGDLLTKLRIAKGWTQKKLADSLGWKQPNISRFENENYSSQTVSKIVEYASELGVWLHVSPSMEEKTKRITFTRIEDIPAYDVTSTRAEKAHKDIIAEVNTANDPKNIFIGDIEFTTQRVEPIWESVK